MNQPMKNSMDKERIIMKKKYPHIFEPITVKRTTIKNRIAMTPMGSNYGEGRHRSYHRGKR